MDTQQSRQVFVAGDDWQFDAIASDSDGNTVDLTNTDLDWFLFDSQKNRVIDGYGVKIEVKDYAAGKCSISVAAAVAATLDLGVYTDFLRLSLHNGPGTPILLRATVWEGTIAVNDRLG